MLLSPIKFYAALALAGVMTIGLAAQTYRYLSLEKVFSTLELQVAQKELANTQAVNKEITLNAEKQTTHAEETLDGASSFSTNERQRDSRDVVRITLLERLQREQVSRFATYRAQASANQAACSNLVDRLESLDSHIVQGNEVVGGLQSSLERRDNEVVLLMNQIKADRRLLEVVP